MLPQLYFTNARGMGMLQRRNPLFALLLHDDVILVNQVLVYVFQNVFEASFVAVC